MSAITRYVGIDPNGTTSTMAQVQVTANGFLNIATIPADEKYVFRFWVKANTVQSCQVLQENESLLDFQSSNDWQEKKIKFEGETGNAILVYLPVGTYYFWHSKLEVGTMESDYSQSQQDFEDLITETTATFNSRIEQTARSITSEVSRAINAETMAFSRIAQLADRIVLKVDSQGKLVEVALGVDADKSQSYFTLDADNISITGTQLVEIISESDATISANNLSLTGEEIVSIISSDTAKIQANNIGLTSSDVVSIISSGLAKIQASNIGLTSSDVVSIISSGVAKIQASNIGLTSSDVVSIISSGTAKIQAQNISISTSDISGINNYYTRGQTDSQINQSALAIESVVASAQGKYDATEFIEAYPPGISFHGYGNPNTAHPYDEEEWGTMSTILTYGDNELVYGQNKIIYGRKYYLDQETGEIWYTTSLMTQWNRLGVTLPLMSDRLSSRIEQQAESIVLSVDDNGNVVAVELSADRATGTTNFIVRSDNISLEGKTINLTSDNIVIESTNFSVDETGDVTANNLTLLGGSININDKFIVDANGNLSAEALDSIELTVAQSQGKYDEGYYNIDYYGFGSPNDKYIPSSTYSGKYYLNVENGTLYKCASHTYYYSWDTVQTLQLITDELSSRISQTATGISFSLTKSGEDTAVLSMTYTKEDGSVISLSSQRLTFNGLVEFTDLSGNGTTTINGNNITTGTISADRIDVTGLFAKDITATGTIRGVTLMGADVYSKDTLKMFYSYGTSSNYVTVLSITRQASFTLPTGVTVSNVPITSVGGGDYVTFSGMTRFLNDVYLSDFLHTNKNINFYDDSTGIYFSKAGKILRSSGTNSENVSFYDIRNSKWLIDIQSAGTYFKTTAYTSSGAVVTSDRNAKHDIVDIDIEESNNFIQSLKPVSFKYNDGTSDRDHHGFIAQDVKESMGDKDWGIYIDDNGNKGLRYEEIIADLVGTVQYQSSIINELRSELSAIQQILSSLGV